MKNKSLILVVTLLGASLPFAHASGDHSSPMKSMQHEDGMTHDHGGMKMDKSSHEMESMQDMFMEKRDIDGYTVSFHIIQPSEKMQKGGTHHLMVKVEKDGELLSDIVVNSKASHPNGATESKMMMKMGDWFMAGYDLGHEGRHQLMVLFKTSDEKKHFIGVYYPQDKKEMEHKGEHR